MSGVPVQTPQSIMGNVANGYTGQALSGVTVLLKGISDGTTTTAEGAYRISVPAANATTLVVSYVGYLSQEIAVGGRSAIAIKLAPGDETLSEVGVVGYGTQQEKDLTGAIATGGAWGVIGGR